MIDRDLVRSLLQASEVLISRQEAIEVLETIVKQLRLAAGAKWVSVTLIGRNEAKRAIATDGWDKKYNIDNVMRPNGHSMEVMRTGKEIRIGNIDNYSGKIPLNPRTIREGLKAVLCLPFALREERIGVVWLNFDEVREFTEGEIMDMRLFVNQAAIAYDNTQQMEQLRKAKQTAELTARLSTIGDYRTTLNALAEGTLQVLTCHLVSIFVYDATIQEFEYPPARAGMDHPNETDKDWHVKHDSILYQILNRDEPYIVEDITRDPLFKDRPIVIRENIKSCMAVPLKVRDQKAGVMFINYREFHHFTPDERTSVNLFANQAAIAIRYSQVYEQALKRNEVLEGLRQAEQAIARSVDLGDVLSQIVRQAINIVGNKCQQVGCFSYVSLVEGRKLRIVAGSNQSILEEMIKKIGEINLDTNESLGITGYAAIKVKSLNIGDVHNFKQYIPVRSYINSQLAVPIEQDGAVIGVISIEHPSGNAFTEEDENNIEVLAKLAAVAIDKAEFLEQTEYQAERAATLQRRTIEINSQINSLRVANSTRSNTPIGDYWNVLQKVFPKICSIFEVQGYILRQDKHNQNIFIIESSNSSSATHNVKIFPFPISVWNELHSDGFYITTPNDYSERFKLAWPDEIIGLSHSKDLEIVIIFVEVLESKILEPV